MESSKKIKFGIIGCGNIAQRHAKHITNHIDAELAGCFDINSEKSDQLSVDFNSVSYSDYASFLAADLDIVSVCTPSGLHKKHATDLMQAGKNVLVEKPMALSTADAAAMIKVSEETGQRLYVVKQNRFNPPVVAVKEWIDQGKLGEIYQVQINSFWNRDDAYYTSSNWKGTKALDGGVLYNQFSHFVDILYYLFGQVEFSQGKVQNQKHNQVIEFEDAGNFFFKLKAGATGSLNFSINAFNENMEGSITVLAEFGSFKIGGKYLNTLDYQSTNGFDVKHLPNSAPANNYGYYQGSMSNHDKVIDNVVKNLQGKEPVMTTSADGLEVVKMIENFYKSAETR